MAEITRLRSGELLRGVFEILKDHPDGLPAKEVLDQIQAVVPPTEFENTHYPKRPGVRRYEKIIRFLTINAVKAGWLIKGKGHWKLSDEGGRAYRDFQDPEGFFREAVRLFKKWKEQQPDEHAKGEDSATLIEEAEEVAWSQIEDYLTKLGPYDFQNLVSGLLRGMDYHISWVAPPGPDGGMDIVAHTDPLGIQGPRIKVQVKRQQTAVNVAGIRAFLATLGDGDSGLFVSTGGFTSDAEREARGQEKRRLMLVDLQRLFDLWIEHYGKIPEAERRLFALRSVYYLAPEE